MKYTVELTTDAQRQLDHAYVWYEQRDADVAVNWYNGFLSLIASLAEKPQRCGLARESEDFPYDVFAVHYGSGRRNTHRAAFRIVGQSVQVLAIRHHAQRTTRPAAGRYPLAALHAFELRCQLSR